MTDTLIERNPDILDGTPVFAGTRVPVRILMERLEAGDRLDDFLIDHPSVSRHQAIALLEQATTMLCLKAEFGFRPFPKRGGIVTNALIDHLREEAGD